MNPDKNLINKCIWMTAGVVNYKLCEHDFKCETCDFDKAMRGVISDKETCFCLHHSHNPASAFLNLGDPNEDRIAHFLANLLQNCKLHLDRLYHSSHFWIKCLDDEQAILGIDNVILELLHPIDKIILPELNSDYQRDQLVTMIVKKQHMFSLHIPLPGRVTEINTNFINQVNSEDPKGRIYLFKLRGPEISKDKIFSEGKIGGFHTIRCKIELLEFYLRQLFRNKSPAYIGTTLADGGIIENDLEKILGETKYRSLLADLQLR